MDIHTRRQIYFPDNLLDYPAWVAKYGLAEPYGTCQCGCGNVTNLIASDGEARHDIAQHKRCLQCHKACKPTANELFWSHIVRENDPNACWQWKGKIHSQGYGIFTFRGKEIYAHRFSHEYHFGEIPSGLWALHKCDNPPCCNPNHLFLGTNADNVADAVAKGRNLRGEAVGTSKLTEEAVIQIKTRLLREKTTQTSLAIEYGVSQRAIGKIANGATWKHIHV